MPKLVFTTIMILTLSIFVPEARAIIDPLAVPNNRIGVHILDTSEVEQAAKLVNSNGGKWGYVTIPLRSNDRDRDKWIKFFEDCRKYQVIPIVRLATYPDPEVRGWAIPSVYDLVDFANFLQEMPWPVKNRYIVLFNEINHAAEWGGKVSPLEYATMLIDAKRVFKSRSDDFFLISAGLDMSAPTNKTSRDALEFLRQISQLQPEWYSAIDGLSVHAYPNPGFSSSVFSKTRYGVASYRHELELLRGWGYPLKPLFITETGWKDDTGQYAQAYTQVWTEPHIVAITPFLLYSASGDFAGFSLLDPNLSPKPKYRQMLDLAKIAGSPLLSQVTFTPQSTVNIQTAPFKTWGTSLVQSWSMLWRGLMGQKSMQVGSGHLWVEVADSQVKRSRGLSGRSNLSKDTGMLFTFENPGKHKFWMKEMQFGLDFIWFRDGQVVQIDRDVQPPSRTNGTPVVVEPQADIDSVLEVNSGWSTEYGITVGMEVDIP